MKFYKPLKKFKAISFDLDDTLYDNHPIIERAEVWIIDHLQKTYPELNEFTRVQWLRYKTLEAKASPDLTHDVTAFRIFVLTKVMVIYGIPHYKAIEFAIDAINKFIEVRSDFIVPKESIVLLDTLAKHYPIVAITNGNVDLKRIQLDDKFQLILRPENGLLSKPEKDLFVEAAIRLKIDVTEILHVGDHLLTDVFGAQNIGAQAVWFNPNHQDLTGAKLLPSVEIHRLENLLKLI